MKRLVVALSLAFCAPAHAQVGVLYDTVAVLTYEDGTEHRLSNSAAPLPLDECEAARPVRLLSLFPYMQARPDLVEGMANVEIICVMTREGV